MNLTEREANDLLATYRHFLLKVAHEYARNLADVYDLAQEGHIAMWRALKTYDERVKLSTHLMNHARWRIIELTNRGNFTGMESRQGRKHVAGTANNRDREQVTDPTASTFDADFEVDYDSVAVAYHHGEIYDAINTLPMQQREQIYRRFWAGDYDPHRSAWWFAKRIGARDRLKERLGHLEQLLERMP